MSETVTEPTAAQFREPLLRALGRLTGLRPDVAVKVDAVRAEVYRETGFTEDQFGIDVPTSSPRLRLVVQQAFNKNLKAHGLTRSEDRGEWMLTEQGVAIATAMLGQDPPPVNPAMFDGGTGPAWSLGPQVNTYNSDPYITSLAIAATACYGEFSARSDVCGDCPVSGACKGATLVRLTDLARTLRIRDEERRRKEAEEEARRTSPPPPPPVDIDDIGDIIRAIEQEAGDEAGEEITVDSSSKCSACKLKIERGAKAMWIKNRGIFHHACYDNLPKAGQ